MATALRRDQSTGLFHERDAGPPPTAEPAESWTEADPGPSLAALRKTAAELKVRGRSKMDRGQLEAAIAAKQARR